MLKNHGFALEAGGEDKIPPVGGHCCKCTGRLHVNVLELVKLFGLHIPEVDLCEGIITAQRKVVPVCEGERLEDHRSSRGQSLHLSEHLIGPLEDFGVTDVARHGQIQLVIHPERFDRHHIVDLRDFTVKYELQGALVPQEDDRWLRATGYDEVGLPVHLYKLSICIPKPLVEELVRVETSFIAVWLVSPLVQSRQTRLGAVHNHKVPSTVHLEDLNVIWLRDVEDLDSLKLCELVLLIVKLVNMGAAEELRDNYQDVVVDQNRLASNNRLPCEDKKVVTTQTI